MAGFKLFIALRVMKAGLGFAVAIVSSRVELYNGYGALLLSRICNRPVSEATLFRMDSEMIEVPVLLTGL